MQEREEGEKNLSTDHHHKSSHCGPQQTTPGEKGQGDIYGEMLDDIFCHWTMTHTPLEEGVRPNIVSRMPI